MNEWVSVKDRLPESGKRYLVQIIEPNFQAKVIDIFRYESGVWKYEGIPIHADVTHWMPLPEPPKEG